MNAFQPFASAWSTKKCSSPSVAWWYIQRRPVEGSWYCVQICLTGSAALRVAAAAVDEAAAAEVDLEATGSPLPSSFPRRRTLSSRILESELCCPCDVPSLLEGSVALCLPAKLSAAVLGTFRSGGLSSSFGSFGAAAFALGAELFSLAPSAFW
eukprot:CAMPEP_0197700284 /NCGR_PEP_ID=MMETSP1338-20131121/121804_1 /TAXON_ID=43686 ORGANISM="Pelagodinium beii, Strain RCC1491" /NCGR_SAMPLE_ID=MMETSP1338 /ASSEMBLY_ACC=CAM_ASM_000754 /LENGTH=153 /DNA_ID=CAMNT_0043283875 /DNA_START=78 /DNA_END=539 /DNA_ORIENTATION=-